MVTMETCDTDCSHVARTLCATWLSGSFSDHSGVGDLCTLHPSSDDPARSPWVRGHEPFRRADRAAFSRYTREAMMQVVAGWTALSWGLLSWGFQWLCFPVLFCVHLSLWEGASPSCWPLIHPLFALTPPAALGGGASLEKSSSSGDAASPSKGALGKGLAELL